jgi:hypothetical protein
MLYSKPYNKSYTALAMEFDAEFYSGHRDDNKLYRYMYLLYYMLSCKKKYFQKFEDYDAYSQFAATTIYMRFIKKEKQGEKIKSVLNYVKSTLYSLKVMYQNDTFNEVWTEEDKNSGSMKSAMGARVQADYNEDLRVALIDGFKQLPKLVQQTIQETPYKNDALMCQKLYLSCMLSLIKAFTPTAKVEEKMKDVNKDSDAVLLKSINKDRDTSIVLWHLDSKLTNYIQTLTNKVRVLLSKEIEATRKSYILEDNVLDAILNSVYDDYDTGDVATIDDNL